MPSTYTNLHYHIVFSTKDRQPFLRDCARQLHEYLGGCVRTLGGTALHINGSADHVHVLVRLKPTLRLSDVLRDIKRPSSEWMQQKIRQFRWQDGYSAFTVSASQIDRVRQYIERQEEHHRKRSFEGELREILSAHGIVYDERYLL